MFSGLNDVARPGLRCTATALFACCVFRPFRKLAIFGAWLECLYLTFLGTFGGLAQGSQILGIMLRQAVDISYLHLTSRDDRIPPLQATEGTEPGVPSDHEGAPKLPAQLRQTVDVFELAVANDGKRVALFI